MLGSNLRQRRRVNCEQAQVRSPVELRTWAQQIERLVPILQICFEPTECGAVNSDSLLKTPNQDVLVDCVEDGTEIREDHDDCVILVYRTEDIVADTQKCSFCAEPWTVGRLQGFSQFVGEHVVSKTRRHYPLEQFRDKTQVRD